MIVALLNPMPGVGKTLLATHLADDLSGDGGGTVLIDADPSVGATRWMQRRLQARCPSRFRSYASSAMQLREGVCEIGQIAAHVVIDLPSRMCPLAQRAVMLADVVLVPWQIERHDTVVIASIARTIAAARAYRPALRAAVVLNGCVSDTRPKESARRAWLHESLPVLACEVQRRGMFTDSTSTGLLVRELVPRDDSIEDVRQLAQTVRALV